MPWPLLAAPPKHAATRENRAMYALTRYEAAPGIEPGYRALQALVATDVCPGQPLQIYRTLAKMERKVSEPPGSGGHRRSNTVTRPGRKRPFPWPTRPVPVACGLAPVGSVSAAAPGFSDVSGKQVQVQSVGSRGRNPRRSHHVRSVGSRAVTTTARQATVGSGSAAVARRRATRAVPTPSPA